LSADSGLGWVIGLTGGVSDGHFGLSMYVVGFAVGYAQMMVE
jgi:hypothetical protein